MRTVRFKPHLSCPSFVHEAAVPAVALWLIAGGNDAPATGRNTGPFGARGTPRLGKRRRRPPRDRQVEIRCLRKRLLDMPASRLYMECWARFERPAMCGGGSRRPGVHPARAEREDEGQRRDVGSLHPTSREMPQMCFRSRKHNDGRLAVLTCLGDRTQANRFVSRSLAAGARKRVVSVLSVLVGIQGGDCGDERGQLNTPRPYSWLTRRNRVTHSLEIKLHQSVTLQAVCSFAV